MLLCVRTCVLVLALAIAQATCDGAAFDQCSVSFSKCMATKSSGECACRASLNSCLRNAACPVAVLYSVVTACQQSGCSAAECAPSRYMSTLDQIAEADTCNAPTLDICNVNLEDCVTAHASQPAAICECRGAHTACVQNAGCSTATVSAVVGVCEESGCLAKQCRPALAAALSSNSPGDCGVSTLESCNQGLDTCVEAHSTDPNGICVCRGAYDACIAAAGCPQATVQAAIAACEEAGCTATQCSATSLASKDPCDSPSLQACGATLSECVKSSNGPTSVCVCRGGYDQCLQAAGCPSYTVAAVVAVCEETGCSPAQCAA